MRQQSVSECTRCIATTLPRQKLNCLLHLEHMWVHADLCGDRLAAERTHTPLHATHTHTLAGLGLLAYSEDYFLFYFIFYI